ncbi:MAG: VCP-like ATPase [Candidatus Lokiarchaeum sp. GC14_75]|nr:MAG: VCP-like ATPase [Candidatus Lokiarchaeum sp. GC14_75]
MSGLNRKSEGDNIKVRVRDAYKRDAGRCRIRIDPDVIKELNLKTGDVIEVEHPVSGKKTAPILYPGKDQDKGINAVRIDSSLQRNINAHLDDFVKIRRIEVRMAERITFAAVKEAVIIRNSDQLVRKLENRIITKGDVLSFNAIGKRIDFVIIDYFPKADAVRIHLGTRIIISEKTYREIENELKKIDNAKELRNGCKTQL